MKTRIRGNRIFLQSIGLLILRNAKRVQIYLNRDFHRQKLRKSIFREQKIFKIDFEH